MNPTSPDSPNEPTATPDFLRELWYLVVPGAGLFSHEERPAEVAEALLRVIS